MAATLRTGRHRQELPVRWGEAVAAGRPAPPTRAAPTMARATPVARMAPARQGVAAPRAVAAAEREQAGQPWAERPAPPAVAAGPAPEPPLALERRAAARGRGRRRRHVPIAYRRRRSERRVVDRCRGRRRWHDRHRCGDQRRGHRVPRRGLHGRLSLATPPLHAGHDQREQSEDEPQRNQRDRADEPKLDRRYDVLAECDDEVALPAGLDHHVVGTGLVDLDDSDLGAGEVTERVVQRVLGRADLERAVLVRYGDVKARRRLGRRTHGLLRAAGPGLRQVLADPALALVEDGVGARLVEGDRRCARSSYHLEPTEVVDAALQVQQASDADGDPTEDAAGQQERADPVPAFARLQLGRRRCFGRWWRERHGQDTPRRSTTSLRRSRGCTTATRT